MILNMEENLVLILSTANEELCKKAKAVLKKAKISCEVVNKKENNVFVGEMELFVNMEDLGQARSILKGFDIE
jgi:hypothetical protein